MLTLSWSRLELETVLHLIFQVYTMRLDSEKFIILKRGIRIHKPVISRNVQMAYEAMVRQQTLSMFGSDSADSAEEEPASKRAKNEEYKHEDDVDSFLPAKTSTATDVDIQLELPRRAEAQSRAAVGLAPSPAGSLYKDVQEAFDKMSR